MKSILMKKFSGTLPLKNLRLDDAKSFLTITESEYTSPESLMPADNGISYYHALFDKGADIYPRNLWFVKIPKHDVLSFNPQKPFVQTDDTIASKPPWNKISIEGTVERQFLFATALGDDIVPFGILHFKPVVLPILITRGRISLIKGSKIAQSLGYSGLANYMLQVEKAWTPLAKNKKLELFDYLDFRKKLTNQHPKTAYKVLYSGSATYLTATVFSQSEKFQVPVNGSFIELGNFIPESKTYVYETNCIDEAFFLCSILNSGLVDRAIKPLQTRGLWGARDIHKRPLLLPIPQFDKSSKVHMSLAKVGKECHEKTMASIASYQKYRSIGKARSNVRVMLLKELKDIDELVTKVFIHSKSGLLNFT